MTSCPAHPEGPSPTPRVAVIGAGIAGLAAAIRLAERGCDVTVFEERLHLGGKLGAHPRRLLRIDRGADGLPPGGHRIRPDRGTAGAGIIALTPGDYDALVGALEEEPPRLTGVLREWFHRRAGVADAAPPAQVVRRGDPAPAAVSIGADTTWHSWRVTQGNRVREINVYRRTRAGVARNVICRLEVTDAVLHEHCFHMFMNWYHNFWALMADAGSDQRTAFTTRSQTAHLFPGTGAVSERLRRVTQPNALEHAGENLFCGVAPPADMFLWFHSMADMVSRTFAPQKFLDNQSVAGYMSSRWYATEGSAALHDHVLAKAFAVPPYLISAAAYRRFSEFTIRTPDPMLWVLRSNSGDGLLSPLQQALTRRGGHLRVATRVDSVVPCHRGFVVAFEPADIMGPALPDDDGEIPEDVEDHLDTLAPTSRPGREHETFDFVILAVPPQALAHLMQPLLPRLPGLPPIRKLQSGVTAVLDLHFRRRLPDIPDVHVILRDARFGLALIDNSQVWDAAAPVTGERPTCLSVGATDFPMLKGMSKVEAQAAIIAELRRFIPFSDEDVDTSRTYMQMNDRESMFVNEVGSEQWQPGTRTDLPGLFIAGDFCAGPIGIATVESAVISGLQAARAVQADVRAACTTPGARRMPPGMSRLMTPIAIETPQTYPTFNTKALVLGLTPYAAAAKSWSQMTGFAQAPASALSLHAVERAGSDMIDAPAAWAGDVWQLSVDALSWAAGLARGDR